VLVDRTGAEVFVRRAGASQGGEVEVEGAEFPLTKVAAGGWSQCRIQQRAENTWRRNMADLAHELAVWPGASIPP
jgi:Bacterial archaeo-eukaryotic release factor family 2